MFDIDFRSSEEGGEKLERKIAARFGDLFSGTSSELLLLQPTSSIDMIGAR